MRDVTLVIFNSLRIKCHIRRPLLALMLTSSLYCRLHNYNTALDLVSSS